MYHPRHVMLRTRILLLWMVPSLAACGAPKAGASCMLEDRYACESSAVAIECRAKVWRELPCKGPKGCVSSGGQVTCDISRDVAGDACGIGAEGAGICTVDGHAVLECREGVLVQTKLCPTACSGDEVHLSCH